MTVLLPRPSIGLRERVASLDDGITCAVCEHTIEYKLDGNMVSVQPQRDRLAVWLNVRYGELKDPDGLTIDVSGVGHFGSGDVRVNVPVGDLLDGVMALVRQSYERHDGRAASGPG